MGNYLNVLNHIHKYPQSFQSNHFRGNSGLYAEAASRGHISALENGRNTGRWHITASGLTFLSIHGGITFA